MTPRTWFTLALRVLGAWVAIDGVDQLVSVVNIRFGVASPVTTQLPAFLLHGVVKIVIGFVLLRFAPVFSAYFYAPAHGAPPDDSDKNL